MTLQMDTEKAYELKDEPVQRGAACNIGVAT